MKRPTTIYFIILLLCFGLIPNIFGQSYQDSLIHSDWLKRHGHRESSLSLLDRVLEYAELHRNAELKAEALYEKAAWHNYFMQYDSAIAFGQQALAFIEEQNLSHLQAKFLLQNGWLVLRKYDAEKALEFCRAAKQRAEQEELTLIRETCNTCIEDALGIYYLGALDDDYYYPVVHAYENVLPLYKEAKDTSNYVNYLTRYIDLYRLKGKADSVQLLLAELENIHQHYTDYRMEATLYTLQSIYASMIGDGNGEYSNLRKAQQKSRQLGLDRLTQHYYFRLHDYYKGVSDYRKAIEMLDSARATFHVDHMHADGLDLYYYTYKEAGNTEKALEYLEQWHNSEDWKRKNEKVDLITEWETKYKTQEKEALLTQSRLQRSWLLAFLLLILAFSAFIISAYRRQKKNNKQLHQQKQIIESQAGELQQLDKMKSRFFANISHELRTPLTLLLGPVNSILKKGDINNRNFTLLKLAQSNGTQLLKLINSILDLSRLESGRLELKEKAVVLYPLITRICSQFESGAQLQEIALTIDYQLDAYLKVQLDISKFEMILNNLLSNAIKFTPKGGQIQVVCKDLSNKIDILVADTGAGIHPDDLPFVFDRFYQTKQLDAPTEGGSGIGLALSMELAKLFQGELSVESEFGKGSTFRFVFPKREVLGFVDEKITEEQLHPAHQDQNKKKEEQLPVRANQDTAKANTHILLVEDNPSLRQYLQIILGEQYQITTAQNGKIALAQLEQSNKFRLIISDVMMPIMDGYQLLEQLKSDDRWRQLPVIMLTARAELRDKLKALRIGVDDYILKPFEEDELLVRVANVLTNTQARQQQEPVEGSSEASDIPAISKVDVEWLEQVELSVQSEIENPRFNLNQLSRSLFISERQFNRKIKKLTGLTPNKYIREIKLQHARSLLENRTFLTVAQVSQAIGYSKTEYFSQLYKERFGKLPSEYLI